MLHGYSLVGNIMHVYAIEIIDFTVACVSAHS